MQMKYLSLALATALASTLTACSSDSDANNNVDNQHLVPVVTDPGATGSTGGATGNTGGATGNTGDTAGNTGSTGDDKGETGGNTGDTAGNTGDTAGNTGGTGAGTEVEDPKNNIGDAANPGNPRTNNIVVAQNYVRGEGTKFDRTMNPNPENDGNPTVLGYNDLENRMMSNIVLADAQKKKDDPKSLLTILAGQDLNKANSMSLRQIYDNVITTKDTLEKKYLGNTTIYSDTADKVRLKKLTSNNDTTINETILKTNRYNETFNNDEQSLQERNSTGNIGSTVNVAIRGYATDPITAKTYKDAHNSADDAFLVLTTGDTFANATASSNSTNFEDYHVLVDKTTGKVRKSGDKVYIYPKTDAGNHTTDNIDFIAFEKVEVAPIVYDNAANVVGAVEFDNSHLKSTFDNAYASGLVVVKTAGKATQNSEKAGNNDVSTDKAIQDAAFVMRGQEDQVITEEKGKVKILQDTGEGASASYNNGKNTATTTTAVRMFGALYKNGDIPLIKSDGTRTGFEPNPDADLAVSTLTAGGNPTLSTSIGDLKFDPTTKKFVFSDKTVADRSDSKEITDKDFNRNSYAFATKRVNDSIESNDLKGTLEDLDGNNRKIGTYVLQPSKIHLDHVQYGRVTVQADNDALSRLVEDIKADEDFTEFYTVNKHEYVETKSKAAQDKDNTTIDYYFARGLEPTKGEDMPKEGKINYLGHALMYGLDNSYHGVNQGSNSNAPLGKTRHAVGNFVAAQLDTATKDVTGKVYNVWTVDSDHIESKLVEDDLVTFKGSVNDKTNSVLGTATRTYVANDAEAAFKGGFFGSNADELSGNINSIAGDKYGDSKWGGVFGARRVDTTNIIINNGVEVKNP